MSDLLRVRATRNFGKHVAGDELLVADTPEHRANIKAGLYLLLESPEPKAKAKAVPKPKAASKSKAKPRATKGSK